MWELVPSCYTPIPGRVRQAKDRWAVVWAVWPKHRGLKKDTCKSIHFLKGTFHLLFLPSPQSTPQILLALYNAVTSWLPEACGVPATPRAATVSSVN